MWWHRCQTAYHGPRREGRLHDALLVREGEPVAKPADWSTWHDSYEDPQSPLSLRLALVQEETRKAIERQPPGPIRLVSICAGQGRDVIGVLVRHPRRGDVAAALLEFDPENVEQARQHALAAGLANVSATVADASCTDCYDGVVPADVILICGVFGHLSPDDVRRTIRYLPHLCGTGATIVWTRHAGLRHGSANLTPSMRIWFQESGFEELAFRTTADGHGVGAHQLVAPPQPYEPGLRLFTFLDPTPK